MAAVTVDIETFTEADFSRAFKYRVGGQGYNFTGLKLLMMVRKRAADVEVFISLDSGPLGGIVIEPYSTDSDGLFSIFISRELFSRMPEGEYVHSLLIEKPDGTREDLWRGTLTNKIGPTR